MNLNQNLESQLSQESETQAEGGGGEIKVNINNILINYLITK